MGVIKLQIRLLPVKLSHPCSHRHSNALGGGVCHCVSFPGKKCYEGERVNIISVMMGWVGVEKTLRNT